ncbi:MAG: hypothetical protein DRH57_07970 [Candidatus Cloacimonadota bacterium]|nr:MAG: hypothetical protein DRH57_07970 [Candidatus Cloacimonadota bacterium]
MEKSPTGKKKEDKADIAFIEEQLVLSQNLYELFKANNLTSDFVSNNDAILTALRVSINDRRKSFFLRNGILPTTLKQKLNGFEIPWRSYNDVEETFAPKYSDDIITKLSQTPTIKLSGIKSMADSLDMIIFPFDYIDKNSYGDEEYSLIRKIDRFNDALKDTYDMVVLAPINHYSLTNHAKAINADREIYAGKHSMVFTSVLMNIPMFRSILNDLGELRDNVESLSGTISNVEKNMEMMQKQITSLQKQLDQQKERQLKAEIAHQEAISSMSAKLSEMAFRVTDPVLFAIPKGTDINDMNSDETLCFVGPVWGPDFDGVALFQLDMEIIKNQRNILNKSIEKVW